MPTYYYRLFIKLCKIYGKFIKIYVPIRIQYLPFIKMEDDDSIKSRHVYPFKHKMFCYIGRCKYYSHVWQIKSALLP